MNLFEMRDTDGARKTYIVTDNIAQAIEIFKQENNNCYPEIVINITSDGETVKVSDKYRHGILWIYNLIKDQYKKRKIDRDDTECIIKIENIIKNIEGLK